MKARKLLSVILCLCMIMTTISTISPLSAFAATDYVYDGTASKEVYFANNDKDDDGEPSLILEGDIPGVGGKAADDVVYKITPNDTTSTKYTDAYLNPYTASKGNVYAVSYDVLFTGDASMFWELWTYDVNGAYAGQSTGGFTISAQNGLVSGGSIVLPDNVPTSLGVNQWHNIAVEVCCNGGTDISIYIDGVEYKGTLPRAAYGTYCLRSHYYSKTSPTYLDNYYYNKYTTGADTYDEASYQIADITVSENEKVTYDAETKKFSLLDETLTAGELKELISTDYEITIYSDGSYETVLEDTDAVTMASNIIVSNSKAYRYYEFEREDNTFTYSVNADGLTCTVTGFKKGKAPTVAETAVTIPDTVAGYTVTAIGETAFQGITTFGVLTFPDTVKSIGKLAFNKCNGLDIPVWPKDLEVVCTQAFSNAKTSANIIGDFTNTKLKTIEASAFEYSGLRNIVLPDTLETIGAKAFNWCSIGDIVIPDSVTSMGDAIFVTCYSSLTSVRFPRNDSITAIPGGTVSSAYPLKDSYLFRNVKLYIPETIKTIPNELLKDFKDGATVTIYGAKNSAAQTFYESIKAQLEAGTYVNDATYPHTEYEEDGTTVSWSNPTDKDGDGKGELAAVKFVEYDFETNTENIIDEAGYNLGDGSTWENTIGSDCADPITEFETVEGGRGKAAGDTAVHFVTTDGSAGHNYAGSSGTNGTYYFEAATRVVDALNNVGVSLGYYNTSSRKDDPDGDGVKDGFTAVDPIKLYTNRAIVFGKQSDMEIEANRWYTIAFQIPNDGSQTAKLWLNGTEHTVELPTPCYGVRHSRLYTWGSSSNPAEIYYDNYRAYTSATRVYNPNHDKPATLVSNSDTVRIDGSDIYLDPEVTYTVAELKEILTAEDANIRVYSDSTLETLLTDEDNVTNASAVVVGTTNGYSFERVLSYYNMKPLNNTIFDIEVISEADKTAKVTGFNTKNLTETDDLSGIAIPEKIAGYTITEIGDSAFYKNSEIQSVVLPDTVTKIGSNAFASYNADNKAYGNIISVTLPKNLKEIGSGAFQCNGSLKTIELPDGLETIGNSAFYWTGIKELTIPDSVTSIGTHAFRLTGIGYLKLSGGVASYTSGQFSGANTKIAELVIPASVKNIGANVFRDLSEDADGNKTVDNTGKMSTKVYGVKGTYAEEYAAKYGFEFVEIIDGTIVASSGIYGDGSKELAGTDFDLKYGYENLTYKGKLVNVSNEDTTLTITLSLTDEDGLKVVEDAVANVVVPAGKEVEVDEQTGISVAVDELKDGYTARALIVNAEGVAITAPVEFKFSADKKELHVLHIANSFGNDSFSYIRSIAAADGVTLKVQNMYIGGAPLTSHYKNMNENLAKYQPVINTSYQDTRITVKEALESDKWDVVALQCASHGYSKDYGFIDFATWQDDSKGSTTGTPNITTAGMFEFIRDYVGQYAPGAKRVMHMSWSPCEAQAEVMYDARFANEADPRSALFEAQKAAYEYGSTIYSDIDGQMIPSSIAIQYALNTLGLLEHSGELDADDKYSSPVDGEYSIYRDETCHLTSYGKIIAGLTWYEYLTGNDARENPYQNSSVPAELMAQFKEAAHYANEQVVDIEGNEPVVEADEAEISVSVAGGSVEVNGESKGNTFVSNYAVGTALTLTAVAEDENKVFMYWLDKTNDKNNQIVSSNEVLEVVAGSDAKYVAVFADKQTEIYVTFKSNNKILVAGVKDTVEIPENPYIAGYTFDGWYVKGVKTEVSLDVSENTEYIAGFKADATKYDIIISGANEQSGQFAYNEKVTVTPAGKDGKVFTYWTRDGKIVSYSETYSFYVSGATEVVANYASEAKAAQIVLVMAEPVVIGDSKIGFYAERNVPEGYSVVETGILLSQAESFDLSTSGVIKAKAKSTAGIGQYTVRKANVSAGDTWSAKAYLIYSDGTTNYTMYSNTVTKTL